VQLLARQLGRWPIALACVVVLAAAVLLPGLGSFGIWEPQERSVADKMAPRRTGTVTELRAIVEPAAQAVIAKQQLPMPDTCAKQAPPDAVARTLTARAAGWGRDVLGDSDTGRRLPLALLGLLTVLATAGIALRRAGPRAALVTALVMLSMPLLVLQSRQLTSEIGTAAGAALIIYGLCALRVPRRAIDILDVGVGVLALAVGLVLGFAGGGALLGLAVPLLAFAAAGAFGVTAVADGGRALRNGGLRVLGVIAPRAAIGREPSRYAGEGGPALLALVGGGLALAVVIYQIYALREPQAWATPPQRELLGHAIVPTTCWSTALGGVWRADDDLRFIWDSTFEQIAYGTFPWGVLAPIAMAALLASPNKVRRNLGALSLAWAAAAWLASEVFQRKVGFTLYAGFPALALAVGVWLDAMLVERRLPAGAKLVALFVLLAVLDLGKDMQSFTERVSSLLVGSDAIAYPAMAHLVLPTKLWILLLGLVVAGGLVVVFALPARRRGPGLAVALGGTALVAAFWAFGWQPDLATHLSSKGLFETYLDLRKQGDQLVILGDYGDAPHDYAPDAKPEVLTARDQVVKALARPQRVFAVAPATELCQLHREIGGKPYYVLDDRDTKASLLSNRVDGTTDKNPLRRMILHAPPAQISQRPKARVVFDSRVELMGWDMPTRVGRGHKFDVTVYYKVLQPVGGAWQVLMHFDGPAGRAGNGDHFPIENKCQTSTWQPGDYIVDHFTVQGLAPAFPPGSYDVWTGFFTGTNPNWRNMPVSEAPPAMRDTSDRVKITTITVD
jgi:4-amino-4-deoxy-L-arabinose transferase-like glycosyltransferase